MAAAKKVYYVEALLDKRIVSNKNGRAMKQKAVDDVVEYLVKVIFW